MARRLARLLLVFLCAAAIAPETNLGSLLFGAECDEECPDDGPGGRCSVACVACACSHGRPITVVVAQRTPTPAECSPVDALLDVRISEPPPETIFHVPRPAAR